MYEQSYRFRTPTASMMQLQGFDVDVLAVCLILVTHASAISDRSIRVKLAGTVSGDSRCAV
ncbi:hypothetical protein, partial [Xanthomonas hortorum]|uniref:hypothetical protein n=1 Tax=Xanthomonas hortorum TaxID=56454 RepID=UPI002042EB05